MLTIIISDLLVQTMVGRDTNNKKMMPSHPLLKSNLIVNSLSNQILTIMCLLGEMRQLLT